MLKTKGYGNCNVSTYSDRPTSSLLVYIIQNMTYYKQYLLLHNIKPLRLHPWRNCVTCAHPTNNNKMRLVVYIRCPQQYSTYYWGHKYAYIVFNFDRKKGTCLLMCPIIVTLLYNWSKETCSVPWMLSSYMCFDCAWHWSITLQTLNNTYFHEWVDAHILVPNRG